VDGTNSSMLQAGDFINGLCAPLGRAGGGPIHSNSWSEADRTRSQTRVTRSSRKSDTFSARMFIRRRQPSISITFLRMFVPYVSTYRAIRTQTGPEYPFIVSPEPRTSLPHSHVDLFGSITVQDAFRSAFANSQGRAQV
jgi:hypothetical protein